MAYLKRAIMTQRIVDVLREFGGFVQRNKSYFLGNDSITENEDKYRTITQNETFMREMLRKLRDDALLEMYRNCGDLAGRYNLRSKKTVMGYKTAILIRDGTGETTERLMAQVRKFGDSLIIERLAEIEIGKSKIVFEKMEEGKEGYTKVENGQITYKLNKRYERVIDDAELWKASIILAHELQRNPATGDLRGETTEIVLRDLGFIERLTEEYGEKVYENNPEFAILRKVKELCGEEGLKEFTDMAFNHKGSYWDWEEQYWEDYENLDFWTYEETVNAMYHGVSTLFDSMAKRAQKRIEVYEEFISRNGYTIALVCYATGAVEIGIMIDLFTMCVDITHIKKRYEETGDINQFYLDFLFLLFSIFLPARAGKAILKTTHVMTRAYMEKIMPFITSLIGITINEMKKLLDKLGRRK